MSSNDFSFVSGSSGLSDDETTVNEYNGYLLQEYKAAVDTVISTATEQNNLDQLLANKHLQELNNCITQYNKKYKFKHPKDLYDKYRESLKASIEQERGKFAQVIANWVHNANNSMNELIKEHSQSIDIAMQQNVNIFADFEPIFEAISEQVLVKYAHRCNTLEINQSIAKQYLWKLKDAMNDKKSGFEQLMAKYQAIKTECEELFNTDEAYIDPAYLDDIVKSNGGNDIIQDNEYFRLKYNTLINNLVADYRVKILDLNKSNQEFIEQTTQKSIEQCLDKLSQVLKAGAFTDGDFKRHCSKVVTDLWQIISGTHYEGIYKQSVFELFNKAYDSKTGRICQDKFQTNMNNRALVDKCMGQLVPDLIEKYNTKMSQQLKNCIYLSSNEFHEMHNNVLAHLRDVQQQAIYTDFANKFSGNFLAKLIDTSNNVMSNYIESLADCYQGLNDLKKGKTSSLVVHFDQKYLYAGYWYNQDIQYVRDSTDDLPLNCLASDGQTLFIGREATNHYNIDWPVDDEVDNQDTCVLYNICPINMSDDYYGSRRTVRVTIGSTRKVVELKYETQLALQILQLKQTVEKQVGNACQTAVLTVPTGLALKARETLNTMTKLAKFKQAHILSEVVAAAIGHGFSLETNKRNIKCNKILILLFNDSVCEAAAIEYTNDETVTYLDYHKFNLSPDDELLSAQDIEKLLTKEIQFVLDNCQIKRFSNCLVTGRSNLFSVIRFTLLKELIGTYIIQQQDVILKGAIIYSNSIDQERQNKLIKIVYQDKTTKWIIKYKNENKILDVIHDEKNKQYSTQIDLDQIEWPLKLVIVDKSKSLYKQLEIKNLPDHCDEMYDTMHIFGYLTKSGQINLQAKVSNKFCTNYQNVELLEQNVMSAQVFERQQQAVDEFMANDQGDDSNHEMGLTQKCHEQIELFKQQNIDYCLHVDDKDFEQFLETSRKSNTGLTITPDNIKSLNVNTRHELEQGARQILANYQDELHQTYQDHSPANHNLELMFKVIGKQYDREFEVKYETTAPDTGFAEIKDKLIQDIYQEALNVKLLSQQSLQKQNKAFEKLVKESLDQYHKNVRQVIKANQNQYNNRNFADIMRHERHECEVRFNLDSENISHGDLQKHYLANLQQKLTQVTFPNYQIVDETNAEFDRQCRELLKRDKHFPTDSLDKLMADLSIPKSIQNSRELSEELNKQNAKTVDYYKNIRQQIDAKEWEIAVKATALATDLYGQIVREMAAKGVATKRNVDLIRPNLDASIFSKLKLACGFSSTHCDLDQKCVQIFTDTVNGIYNKIIKDLETNDPAPSTSGAQPIESIETEVKSKLLDNPVDIQGDVIDWLAKDNLLARHLNDLESGQHLDKTLELDDIKPEIQPRAKTNLSDSTYWVDMESCQDSVSILSDPADYDWSMDMDPISAPPVPAQRTVPQVDQVVTDHQLTDTWYEFAHNIRVKLVDNTEVQYTKKRKLLEKLLKCDEMYANDPNRSDELKGDVLKMIVSFHMMDILFDS